MGYTHYYTAQREFDATEWHEICSFTRHMLSHLPPYSTSAGGVYADEAIKIVGWRGEAGTAPEIKSELIAFNGEGPNGHESFVIYRSPENEWLNDDPFLFCKTAGKPYDLVVCALLLAILEIAPGALAVSSDGDMQGSEWEPAREWLKELGTVDNLREAGQIAIEVNDATPPAWWPAEWEIPPL